MTDFNYNVLKNRERLMSEPYSEKYIFQPEGYGWPGDWEGRALLAFCCHYKISGEKIPCLDFLMEHLYEKTGGKLYFGKPFDENLLDEQQLSGQNWLLRGLLLYEDCFKDGLGKDYADKLVSNLFMPALDKYPEYPYENRQETLGEVSGNAVEANNGWKLSTDTGCVFMPLDGLGEYYLKTKDKKLKIKLDGLVNTFLKLNPIELKMQTHETLSAVRGILKMYYATGDNFYLTTAVKYFEMYIGSGMTKTYENYNWFQKPNSWTEPCAVVDSLLIATSLYKITGEEKYKTLARRIWFNGLQFCQKENGGAGPNSCVTKENPVLKVSMYEAPFCCTMRYAEGLKCVKENYPLFDWQEGVITKEDDRYYMNDVLLAEDLTDTFKNERHFEVDGRNLILLPSLNAVPEQTALNTQLRILF